jgi:hypothetical protein
LITLEQENPMKPIVVMRGAIALCMAGLAANVAAVDEGALPQQAAKTNEVRNVVLVHSLYADGSSRATVIPLLRARPLYAGLAALPGRNRRPFI